MYHFYNFLKFYNFKIEIERVVINNKRIIYFNVQKNIFYIKIIFSDWVIGIPVNFGGLTGRALAVNLKLNFWKSCDHKKSFFIGPQRYNFMVYPIYSTSVFLPRMVIFPFEFLSFLVLRYIAC
jgi:hypothetical protein